MTTPAASLYMTYQRAYDRWWLAKLADKATGSHRADALVAPMIAASNALRASKGGAS